MRIKLFTAIVLMVAHLTYAKTIEISGCVTDPDTNPIDYASISIFSLPDSVFVKGGLTNELGEFNIILNKDNDNDSFNNREIKEIKDKNVKDKDVKDKDIRDIRVKYLLKVSALGYEKESVSIDISEYCDFSEYTQTTDFKEFIEKNVKKRGSKRVIKIILNPESLQLKEVIVSALRPHIKRTATGIVVSIENVTHLQDKTVDRILNASPGVIIDKEGNISINGNGGVSLIVNDKNLNLKGDQLTSYLKSIQGSDVKNIEIVSNPTSAFSAEGTGGVIIINTRRKSETGLSGFLSMNYSYEQRSSYRPSVGIAYNFEKFTIYGNYTYGDNRNVSTRYSNQTYLTSSQNNTITENNQEHDLSHNLRTGIDFQLTHTQYIGFEYNGQRTHNRIHGNSQTLRTMIGYEGSFPQQPELSQISGISGISGTTRTFQISQESQVSEAEVIRAKSNGKLRPYNNIFTLNYNWEIDTIGQRLKFIADYSDIAGMRTDIIFDNRYFDVEGLELERIWKRSLSYETSHLTSVQIDYEKPFGSNKWKLNSGVKFSHIDIDYRYNLLSWSPDETEIEDPRFKDHFNFLETLYAAYVNTSFNSKVLDANGGIRTELTDRKGYSYIKDQQNSQHKLRVFPSCFLYYKPSEKSGFMAYYGIRIQRPSYALLNPFVSYITDVSYKTGNPDLKPMISNILELTYVFRNRYYLSLRANLTKDKIRDFSYTDGQYSVSTFKNIAGSNMYYFNAYIPLDLCKWASSLLINAGLLETSNLASRRKAFTMDVSWDNYIQLSKNVGIQGNLTYSPPYKDVYQTFKKHIVKIDLCMDWSFAKDKWSLSAGVDDLLNSMRKRTVTLTYPEVHETVITDGIFAGRTFWSTLKYNFSTSHSSREKRKSYSNTEEMNRL